MKKEVLLAVTVGFVLGLLITFGIWTANKNLVTKSPQPTPTPPVSISPTPDPVSNMTLVITSPENEFLSAAASITVTGKTKANSPVSIFSEKNQKIIISDSAGAFSSEVDLEGGYNQIKVIVTDQSGNSISKDLLVTYTTSKI
jgi:hypothetical protein